VSEVLPQLPSIQADMEVEVLHEIPVETLYLALKDSDAETALWFFQNALPEQVQGLVDIDCWEGSEFLPERFETYFKAMTLVTPPKLGRYMRELDPEVIVRGLLENVEVRDFDPQEPPQVPEKNLLLSPDNKYALIIKGESPNVREALRLWLDKFSSIDLELMRRHLEACKWEQASDLEEYAYQIKKGRLEDLGFVDYHEAISLYARGKAADLKHELLSQPLDKGSKYPPELMSLEDAEILISPEFLPEPVKGPMMDEGFLGEALKGIADPRHKSVLVMELLRTINAALAADRVLHESLARISQNVNRSRAYLELGLLYLADANASRASELLESQPLAQVHRLGWLALQDAVKAATEIRNSYGTRLFGEADESLLVRLEGRHPELTQDLLIRLGIKALTIASFEGLLKLGARLTALATIGRFFTDELSEALKLKSEPLAEGESGYSRLLTGLFKQASGGEFDVKGLNEEEWAELSLNFDGVKLDSFARVIVDRCPEAGRAHFRERLGNESGELKNVIEASKSRPDRRFMKFIRWEA
jgi:hypothetical protein